mmetsp:Transcript_16176/g.31633  ORF Transcript_16176/g.31633 Transcript_16176/m.31633 type:complete len:251 (-) Transcript_16176:124-876(-)
MSGGTGSDPYLPLPAGTEASSQARIPIEKLPELPARGVGYWAEPWCGIFTVLVLSLLLVGLTTSVAAEGRKEVELATGRILVSAIWTWAAIAAACTAYIILGGAGEIKRSPETCYPIPDEVYEKLLTSQSLDSMRNVDGPQGSTYCVRCLVWRPPTKVAGRGHHCNTCQRCVTGFDHHCGVFGRCIVAGNMPCFYAVMAMFVLGSVTAMGTMFVVSGDSFRETTAEHAVATTAAATSTTAAVKAIQTWMI